jgi:hypothetical protein
MIHQDTALVKPFEEVFRKLGALEATTTRIRGQLPKGKNCGIIYPAN